jgi:hypothetical protein
MIIMIRFIPLALDIMSNYLNNNCLNLFEDQTTISRGVGEPKPGYKNRPTLPHLKKRGKKKRRPPERDYSVSASSASFLSSWGTIILHLWLVGLLLIGGIR